MGGEGGEGRGGGLLEFMIGNRGKGIIWLGMGSKGGMYGR